MATTELKPGDERRLRRAILRDKYSKIAPDYRYGTCHSENCQAHIMPGERVAAWDGRYWHAECLSDDAFERMSSITDDPAIVGLLEEYCPPITYRRWDMNMATHYEIASSLIDPEKNDDMKTSNLQRRVHETALVAQVRATLALVDKLGEVVDAIRDRNNAE